MHEGKIIEKNNSKDLFSYPKEEYTKKLINSGNEIELKRGRYGFYVTDGVVNVGLKNGEDMEEKQFI